MRAEIQPSIVLETARLILRHFNFGDAPFVLRLLNERSFIEHIGDKGVRNISQAETYLREGPIGSYARYGHGLYAVLLKGAPEPIGMCGLLKREELDDIDLGYAFVPEAWSNGYALEAATAVLTLARDVLGRRRVVALVSPSNAGSIRLLEKLGFTRSHQRAPDSATVLYQLMFNP